MAFQLDSNIPLLSRSADVMGGIQQGIKTSSMLEQLSQSRAEAPIRKDILNQLLEQRGQEFSAGSIAQEQGTQAFNTQQEQGGKLFQDQQEDRLVAQDLLKKKEQKEQLAAQEAAQDKNIKSIANTYSGIKGMVDGGRFNDAADALEANRQVLIQAGATDLQDTDEAIAALRSGDAARIKNIKNLGDQAIQLATDRGLLTDKSEKFSATTVSLPGGISVQTTTTGRKVVTDAGGNVLTGQAAIDAIKDAELAKSQQEIDTAGGKAGAAETAKLTAQGGLLPDIRAAIKTAEQDAQSRGESFSELNSAKAALPGLKTVVGNLKALSSDATFTLAGRGFNAVAKELGLSTKGSTARAAMVAMVDNQVLPLLKPIFGSAFTAAEGDRLRNAFLDPNSTPDSRIASLNAFQSQMERNIEAKELELSLKDGSQPEPSNIAEGATATNPQTGQTLVFRGGAWQAQ